MQGIRESVIGKKSHLNFLFVFVLGNCSGLPLCLSTWVFAMANHIDHIMLIKPFILKMSNKK
jgi:hypothetical protein